MLMLIPISQTVSSFLEVAVSYSYFGTFWWCNKPLFPLLHMPLLCKIYVWVEVGQQKGWHTNWPEPSMHPHDMLYLHNDLLFKILFSSSRVLVGYNTNRFIITMVIMYEIYYFPTINFKNVLRSCSTAPCIALQC